ncbi:alpha/beta hydrolase [Halovivax gelatinilyticus]|uniref:alpha/beta hydrolase n=1 Tax=Halovivax gelatinilyticus TaxID=2961597 RepID=UPI0020CA510E|nr:alpha/beta hydrolase [Halovivax gelatinilyticus]
MTDVRGGEDVLIPGARDVRATVDGPDDPDALVVACPPYPPEGGSRTDTRLRAVGDALADREIGCLRIDYGTWDDGYGECEDVRNAVRWADERVDTVGLFGFSFGGSEAILAAASVETDVECVSALAPTASLGPDLEVPRAVDDLDDRTRLQVIYGTRDEVADWEPVVEAGRERGAEVVEWSADHFFVGQGRNVAEDVADFVERGSGE